jgi:hypothetical protein
LISGGRKPPASRSAKTQEISVAAGDGLAGDKHQSPVGTLPGLIGKGVKNAEDGAIGCEQPDPNDRDCGKSHYEENDQ